MIEVYYSTADDTIEFADVSAVADWFSTIDDPIAIAIVSANLPDSIIQITFGEPRHGAAVAEFTNDGKVAKYAFANRADGARHWMIRVRAVAGGAK